PFLGRAGFSCAVFLRSPAAWANPFDTRGSRPGALPRVERAREAWSRCQSSFLPLKSSGSPCSRLSLLHAASRVRSQSFDTGSPGWLGALAHSGLASTAALLSRYSTPPQALAETTVAGRTGRRKRTILGSESM